MTDEELITELCSAVAVMRSAAQYRIDYITKRQAAIEARGEVVEDIEEVDDILENCRADIACCDRWFEKNGVEE